MYLPEPGVEVDQALPTTPMLSMVVNHSHYQPREDVEKAVMAMYAKYNLYSQSDNEDAKEGLFNSLDADVQRELDLVKDKHDTFIEHWMEVISFIQV